MTNWAWILTVLALGISIYTILAKWQENPRLSVEFSPEQPMGNSKDGKAKWQFVVVKVRNPRLNRIFRPLTYRQTAQRTTLELSYTPYEGTEPKFKFEGRWSANFEPYQRWLEDGRLKERLDPMYVVLGRYRDIVSDAEPQEVAVAIKIEGDEDCYGFTNESYEAGIYREGSYFRLPDYKLPKGKYIVSATAVSSEVRSKTVEFLLHNDGPDLTDLRLDMPRGLSRK